MDVGDDELAGRLAEAPVPAAPAERGYARLYVDRVLQADRGADFDFLVGGSGDEVRRESH